MLLANSYKKFLAKKTTIFYIASLLLLGILIVGLNMDSLMLTVFPPLALLGSLIFMFPQKAFLLFFGILPFSIEVYLPSGLGTDLPTEPMIILFFLLSLIYGISFVAKRNEKAFSLILVLLGAHVSWIFITAISAEYPLISLKYFIAKLWYIFPFFFLSQIFLKQKRDYVQWLNIFFAGFLISIFYVFFRHILLGLSFESIGPAVSPFYRNHVNYGALLIISLPLCWYMVKHSGRGGVYKFIFILLILAIYFSYSRVALVTVVILLTANILLQKRLLFSATFVLGLLISMGIFYLIQNNNYLHYAPNYESTVAHEKFGNLLEATYQMEDISTMERVHRWVAGFNMIKERPWLGYGPNNFYFSYKAHTINSFQTYVSDNPDRSGIHNYFLMVAVEQGLLGFMIFVSMLLTLIYKAEQSFHSAKPKNQRDLIQMSVLVLIAIISLNLINDLLEAVKVGPFFFLSAGIIHQQSLQNTNKRE